MQEQSEKQHFVKINKKKQLDDLQFRYRNGNYGEIRGRYFYFKTIYGNCTGLRELIRDRIIRSRDRHVTTQDDVKKNKLV